MRTQAEVNNLYNQFRAAYPDGTKIDYWGYPGECLSKEKRWLDTLRNGYVGGPMAAPASTNGYGDGYWKDAPAMVREFFDPQPYDPNATYPLGSLFVNTRSGHIGTLKDNQPGQPTALVYEQNADPDGSGSHEAQRSKSRIDGILVLKVAAAVQAAPVPLYTVEPIADRDIKVKAGSRKWNLAYATFADVDANKITEADDNTIFTAKAILHHSAIPQYNYYLEDPNTPHGWNVLDCMDYSAPPAPYIPPAAPYTAPPVEKYRVIVTLMYFPSGNEAIHKSNYQGDILPGEYYVITKNGNAYNLSDDNMKDRGQWVNIDDNKIPEPVIPTLPVDPPPAHDEPVDFPPVIEQPKIVSHSLRADGAVVMYQATNSTPVEIRDYQTGKEPITMQPYNYSSATGKNEPVPLVAQFEVGGETFGITQKVARAGWKYGVPFKYLELYEMPPTAVEPPKQVSSFDMNKDGKVNLSDLKEGFDYIVTPATRAYAQLLPVIEKAQVFAKTNGKQFIDGIRKTKK